MKITDVRIEVVRRTLPDTGLDSDLGRFSGDVEQGVLRIQTDEGIEGNCLVGDFRGGGHGQFGPILKRAQAGDHGPQPVRARAAVEQAPHSQR